MALQPPAAPRTVMVRVPWFVGATRRKVVRRRSQGKTSESMGLSYTETNTLFPGVALNNTDPEQERDPPNAATPVSFPSYETRDTRSWSDESPPTKPKSLFSRIMKPSDISDAHLQVLNIQLQPLCCPDELVPPAADGPSHLPPLSPDQAISPASYADATKVDAATAKKRKEFDERLAELRVDNDTGYRIITRTTKPGPKPPRLGYMRKFWEGLECMSQYWDTELDQLYQGPPPPAVEQTAEKGPKRQRLDSPQTNQVTIPIFGDANKESASNESVKPDDDLSVASQTPLPDGDDKPNGAEDATDHTSRVSSATPEMETCLRYKGRRTGTGREMPDQFRTDTIKSFVEGVVWAFGCSVAAPRHMPIVQMNKLNLPVRQTAAVYRVPKERTRARGGWLEGPIMSIQVRPETDFDAAELNDQQRKTKARLDMMRELGGLLQCAQERYRQGKTEVQPGEGKWWTEKQRWGGGPGGEVEAQEGNGDTKDVLEMAKEMISGTKASKVRKKKTPAMLWKELKCGSKLWDAKTDYEAIGKDPESPYDEIFMVSSLNHHLSILKLTIHSAYIEYLLTEQIPNPPPSELDWCTPKLQRTQWYDMLDIDQRVQAFRALWGVMSYLTREVTPPKQAAEDGIVDTKMSKAGS